MTNHSSPGDTTRTILFADVRGSTGITERLGNVESRRLVGALLAELGGVTTSNNGTVIKTIGDEIMSSFETPVDAASAAIDMQRALTARPTVSGIRAQVGIGLNSGPVVVEEGDLFGDAVNVASRLVGKAAAGQILTTGETLEGPDMNWVLSRSLGDHLLQGREENVNLCEILWRGETAQLTTLAPKLALAPRVSLEIRLGEQVVRRTSQDPDALTLGRGEENSLAVTGASASRQHAKVTTRGGRFYLADHSTNGTYVRQIDGDEILVHRDEIVLVGHGFIRLGDPLSEKVGVDIVFRTSD